MFIMKLEVLAADGRVVGRERVLERLRERLREVDSERARRHRRAPRGPSQCRRGDRRGREREGAGPREAVDPYK